MKVKFVKSPTGVYGLAYFAGDVANVSDEQGKLLIEAEIAKAVAPEGEKEQKEPNKQPIEINVVGRLDGDTLKLANKQAQTKGKNTKK